MAEWSKAAVLKTADVKASKGSNPFSSSLTFSNVLALYRRRGPPETFNHPSGVRCAKAWKRAAAPVSAPAGRAQ